MSHCPNCHNIAQPWRNVLDYGVDGLTPEYINFRPWYADVCFTCGWCQQHKNNYNPLGGGTGANHAGGAVNNVRIGKQDELFHPYDMYEGDRSFKDLGVCSLTDENGNKIIASNYAGIKAGYETDSFNKMYHYWESGYFNWAALDSRADQYFTSGEIVKSNFSSGRDEAGLPGYPYDSPGWYEDVYRDGSIALRNINFLCWNRLYTYLSGGNVVRLLTGTGFTTTNSQDYNPIHNHKTPSHHPRNTTAQIHDAPVVFHGDVKVRFENYKKFVCVTDPDENMTSILDSGLYLQHPRQGPEGDYHNNNYHLESQTLQTSIYSFTDNVNEWPTHLNRYVLGKNSTNGELVQVGSGVSNSPFRLVDLSGTFPELTVDCYWSGGQWNGTVSIDYNPSVQTAIKHTKIYDFYSLAEVNQKFPFIQNGGQLLKYRFDGTAKYTSGGLFGNPVGVQNRWPFEFSGWTGIMDKMGPDHSGFRDIGGNHRYGMAYYTGGVGVFGGANINFSYDPTGGEDWLGQGDSMNHPSSGLVFNRESASGKSADWRGGPLSSKLFYTNGQSLEIQYLHYTGTGVTDSEILNDFDSGSFDFRGALENFWKTGKYITPKWIFFSFLHDGYSDYLHYGQQDLDTEFKGFMWTYDDINTGANWKCVDYHGQEINSPLQPNFGFVHTDDLPARMNFTGNIFTNYGAYDALNKHVQSRSGSNYELADATDVLGSDATINIQALIDPYTVRGGSYTDFAGQTLDWFDRPVPSFISSNPDQLFTLDPRSHQTYANGNWYYTGDGKDQVSGKIICLNPDKIGANPNFFYSSPDNSLTDVTTHQIITGNTAHYDTKFLHDDWLIVKEPCFDYWLSGHSGVTSGYQPLSNYFNREVVGYGALRTPDSALSAGGSYLAGDFDPRRHHNTTIYDHTIFALKKPLSQIDGPSECSKVKHFYSGLGLEFTGNHIEKLRKLISGVSDRSDPLRYYDNPSGFYYEVQNGQTGGLLNKSDYETGKCCSGETVSTDEDCVVFTGKLLTGSSSTHPSYILRKNPDPATGSSLCVGSTYNVTISSGSGDSQFYGEGSPYTWTLSTAFFTYYLYGYVNYPSVVSLTYYSYSLTGTYTGIYGSSPSITVTSGSC